MAYIKLLFREIKKHFVKLITITLMVAVGVGISTGLGSMSDIMDDSIHSYYKNIKFPDLIIKSTSNEGHNQAIFDFLDNENVLYQSYIEYDLDTKRIHYVNFDNYKLIPLELLDGNYPKNADEVLVERETLRLKNYKVGDLITVNGVDYKVSGIVFNPFYFYKQDIPSYINQDININTILYFDISNFEPIGNIKTDIQIYLDLDYKKDYEESVEKWIEKLSIFENIKILTQNEMISAKALDMNTNKVRMIGTIFPIIFTLVILIVVVSSIESIIEKDRLILGTFKSLGIGRTKIKFRYHLIILIACFLGGLVGVTLGFEVLSKFVYNTFSTVFVMPKIVLNTQVEVGIIITVIMTLVMIITVEIMASKSLNEKTAELLRKKAPKPGAKIWLEHIPFIWNRLKFKHKSSLRNIFRYPINFFMQVISILGATALVFAGLSLLDNVKVLTDYANSSIETISYIVIVCAGVLSILVTYNLTNMNVENREREIATLKVLGYKRGEVAMYIYREVFIISTIGILLGIPTGYLIDGVLFDYIAFGSIEHVRYISIFYTLLLSYSFIILSDILLYRKIHQIDMNGALKSLE